MTLKGFKKKIRENRGRRKTTAQQVCPECDNQYEKQEDAVNCCKEKKEKAKK